LFNFSTLTPGSAFFLPHGTTLYNKLVSMMRSEYLIRGYQEVITPNIFHSELWKMSGHYYKYKEHIYFMKEAHGEEEHGLKPMNCPGHCLAFNFTQKSYKDLPIRMADFGVLHRN
jgi:threonyl-tRNA synthetase